jgi:hypothetical protein
LNNVLNILGYDLMLNKIDYTIIFIVENPDEYVIVDATKIDQIVKMKEKIQICKRTNMTYLKPHYIMVYTNIVSESIVGGTMSNFLKVVSIKNVDEFYIMADFEQEDYYELQNTERDTREIQLRFHDSEHINFATQKETIMNLEFSQT